MDVLGIVIRLGFWNLLSILVFVIQTPYMCVSKLMISVKLCASPEATTKSKLAALNEKLDILERRLEVLEVQVSSATTNPSVFT